jgi:hypothetical protein
MSLATHSKTNIKFLEIFTMFPSLLRIENFQNHFNIKFPIHTFGEIWAIKKSLVWRDDLKKCTNFHMVPHFEKCSQSFIVNCECIFGECNGTFLFYLLLVWNLNMSLRLSITPQAPSSMWHL